MEIIFQGHHTSEEMTKRLSSVIRLFEEQYHIDNFREIHVSLTLVDKQGDDVELVDTTTNCPYRVFEVCQEKIAPPIRHKKHLRLLVDNERGPL